MRFHSFSFLPLVLLAASLASCAPVPSVSDEARRQEVELLQKKQQETAREVERLQKSLLAVENRLNLQQQTLKELRGVPAAQKVTRAGEKATAPTSSPTAPPETGLTSPAEMYRLAFGDYASGHCPQAIAGFENFLRLHPHHEQAPNALFWLGECYYAGEQYPKAVEAFGRAAETAPGARAPDALLRVAATLKQMREERRAKEILELLRQKYPDSEAARKSLGSE